MDVMPSFPELGDFGSSNVDIIEQIGINYHKFGTTLLQDGNGCILDAIEKDCRGTSEDINRKVLGRWLKGEGRQPVSWATLATVLDECRLTELSRLIRSVKGGQIPVPSGQQVITGVLAADSPNPPCDMLEVMSRHASSLTSTVSLDLIYFSNKFIDSGFITQTAANNVLTKQAISNEDKASQLLHCIRMNCKITPDKQLWAEKFITVFSSQASYSGLAAILRKGAFL